MNIRLIVLYIVVMGITTGLIALGWNAWLSLLLAAVAVFLFETAKAAHDFRKANRPRELDGSHERIDNP